MALFKKRPAEQQSTPSSWTPTVDLDTDRPVVFALANAPVSNDMQVRSAIAQFVRLSERPSLEQALNLIRTEPAVLHRPWIWLAAVMREATAAGDHHLATAGLYWACYWTNDLVPRNNLGSLMELELDPIPVPQKAELLALGLASASQLPEDFVIVGDETGQIHAGPLAQSAGALLGI
jgi:hypothetical protein